MIFKLIKIIILLAICAALSIGLYRLFKKNKLKRGFAFVATTVEVAALFPTTAIEIEQRTTKSMAEAQQALAELIAIPADQRTYQNTMHAFDTINSLSDLSIVRGAFGALELVSPEQAIREACHEAVKKINEFWIDNVSNNVELYRAIKSYADGRAAGESLTSEQKYFLKEVLDGFKRAGLELPDEQRAQVNALKKELATLTQNFEVHIAQDNRSFTVKREELAGLEDDFINALARSTDGNYVLGVDYPTFFMVMEHCSVPETRKKMYRTFSNRAYPINHDVLVNIIAKRDQLGKMFGFASYAALDLDDVMAKSPERVDKFLVELTGRAQHKTAQEFATFKKDLPESITLTADGKFNPWDIWYLKSAYKKKHLNLDERAVAEYFPMQKTIDGLLEIYKKFMSLEFKQVVVKGLWHEEATCIEVFDNNKQRLGYLILDLYPRPNKFTHACHITVVPSVILPDGQKPPAVSMVLANFPKATGGKPALLKRDDVNTFFHEFGHALHGLLGRTATASFAGTAVKSDFVEMPSQMLEEWLWDKDILRNLSSHYVSGKQMPDELIDKILALKHLDSGYFVNRQVWLASISLDYYKSGEHKDVYALMEDLYKKLIHDVAFDPENHFYASFGHLTDYGAKYYGYLWSKVFALDLFEQIKKQGLLDPAAGHKYVTEILKPGGSVDPNILLRNFLGREPNMDAFFSDLGI